jgi:hypothetical protein
MHSKKYIKSLEKLICRCNNQWQISSCLFLAACPGLKASTLVTHSKEQFKMESVCSYLGIVSIIYDLFILSSCIYLPSMQRPG